MSISSIASRGFSVPFNTSSSVTSQPPAPPPPPQMGSPAGGAGMPPMDMFDAGFRSGSSLGGGGVGSVGGAVPGSRAFGDMLHHAMKSAGVDDETIKTVLSGLNGGRPPGGPQGAGGPGNLGDLMAQLDDGSAQRLQGDRDSLNQLINNPHLTAQLAQAPEVFKMLMTQPG